MTPEKILYETSVIAHGGREGKAQSTDGSFAVNLSVPKGLGGPGATGPIQSSFSQPVMRPVSSAR